MVHDWEHGWLQVTLVESRSDGHGFFFGKLDDGKLWASGIHGCETGGLSLARDTSCGERRMMVSAELLVEMAWSVYPELDRPVVVAAPCYPWACRAHNRHSHLEIVGEWSGPTWWDIISEEGNVYTFQCSDRPD